MIIEIEMVHPIPIDIKNQRMEMVTRCLFGSGNALRF
jgi:hypothetical protein